MPLNPLYPNPPLDYFATSDSIIAGSTQRMLPVVGTNVTGQREVQTYMASVTVLVHAGVWLHEVKEVNPRQDVKGIFPFQLYEVYTTSMTSPDGGLPYMHGDYFMPNGNVVGLVPNTAHPIRGVWQANHFIKLYIERMR